MSLELPAPTHMASVRFLCHLIMSCTCLVQVLKLDLFSQYLFLLPADAWSFSVLMRKLYFSFSDSSTKCKFFTLLHKSSPTLYFGERGRELMCACVHMWILTCRYHTFHICSWLSKHHDLYLQQISETDNDTNLQNSLPFQQSSLHSQITPTLHSTSTSSLVSHLFSSIATLARP